MCEFFAIAIHLTISFCCMLAGRPEPAKIMQSTSPAGRMHRPEQIGRGTATIAIMSPPHTISIPSAAYTHAHPVAPFPPSPESPLHYTAARHGPVAPETVTISVGQQSHAPFHNLAYTHHLHPHAQPRTLPYPLPPNYFAPPHRTCISNPTAYIHTPSPSPKFNHPPPRHFCCHGVSYCSPQCCHTQQSLATPEAGMPANLPRLPANCSSFVPLPPVRARAPEHQLVRYTAPAILPRSPPHPAVSISSPHPTASISSPPFNHPPPRHVCCHVLSYCYPQCCHTQQSLATPVAGMPANLPRLPANCSSFVPLPPVRARAPEHQLVRYTAPAILPRSPPHPAVSISSPHPTVSISSPHPALSSFCHIVTLSAQTPQPAGHLQQPPPHPPGPPPPVLIKPKARYPMQQPQQIGSYLPPACVTSVQPCVQPCPSDSSSLGSRRVPMKAKPHFINPHREKRKHKVLVDPFTQTRHRLEMQFAINENPTRAQIAEMAENLRVSNDFVRVWFISRRKRQKRLETVSRTLVGATIPSLQYNITVEVPSDATDQSNTLVLVSASAN